MAIDSNASSHCGNHISSLKDDLKDIGMADEHAESIDSFVKEGKDSEAIKQIEQFAKEKKLYNAEHLDKAVDIFKTVIERDKRNALIANGRNENEANYKAFNEYIENIATEVDNLTKNYHNELINEKILNNLPKDVDSTILSRKLDDIINIPNSLQTNEAKELIYNIAKIREGQVMSFVDPAYNLENTSIKNIKDPYAIHIGKKLAEEEISFAKLYHKRNGVYPEYTHNYLGKMDYVKLLDSTAKKDTFINDIIDRVDWGHKMYRDELRTNIREPLSEFKINQKLQEKNFIREKLGQSKQTREEFLNERNSTTPREEFARDVYENIINNQSSKIVEELNFNMQNKLSAKVFKDTPNKSKRALQWKTMEDAMHMNDSYSNDRSIMDKMVNNLQGKYRKELLADYFGSNPFETLRLLKNKKLFGESIGYDMTGHTFMGEKAPKILARNQENGIMLDNLFRREKIGPNLYDYNNATGIGKVKIETLKKSLEIGQTIASTGYLGGSYLKNILIDPGVQAINMFFEKNLPLHEAIWMGTGTPFIRLIKSLFEYPKTFIPGYRKRANKFYAEAGLTAVTDVQNIFLDHAKDLWINKDKVGLFSKVIEGAGKLSTRLSAQLASNVVAERANTARILNYDFRLASKIKDINNKNDSFANKLRNDYNFDNNTLNGLKDVYSFFKGQTKINASKIYDIVPNIKDANKIINFYFNEFNESNYFRGARTKAKIYGNANSKSTEAIFANAANQFLTYGFESYQQITSAFEKNAYAKGEMPYRSAQQRAQMAGATITIAALGMINNEYYDILTGKKSLEEAHESFLKKVKDPTQWVYEISRTPFFAPVGNFMTGDFNKGIPLAGVAKDIYSGVGSAVKIPYDYLSGDSDKAEKDTERAKKRLLKFQPIKQPNVPIYSQVWQYITGD